MSANTSTTSPTQQAVVGSVGRQSSVKSNTPPGKDGSGLGAFLSLLISQEPEVDTAQPGMAQSETEVLAATGDPVSVLTSGLQEDVTFLLTQGGQWQPEVTVMPHKDELAACQVVTGSIVLPSGVSQLQLADDVAHFITTSALPALNSGNTKPFEKPGLDSHQFVSGDTTTLSPSAVTAPHGTKALLDASVDAISVKMNLLIAGKGLNPQSEGAVTPAISTLADAKPADRPQSRDIFKIVGSGLDGIWGGAGSSIGPGVLTYSPSVETSVVTPEAVAEQVTCWVNQELQNAELTLDGAGLEPIEVSISLQGKEAHVAFRSDQAATREMLQGAMSHLKEMLANHGLSLSGASVGSSGSGDQNPKGHNPSTDGRKTTVRISAQQTVAVTTIGAIQGARVVDLFV